MWSCLPGTLGDAILKGMRFEVGLAVILDGTLPDWLGISDGLLQRSMPVLREVKGQSVVVVAVDAEVLLAVVVDELPRVDDGANSTIERDIPADDRDEVRLAELSEEKLKGSEKVGDFKRATKQ
ncbi:hypothetical protein AB6A40_010632 [Gnathostoma spinigerum]|uniref:Uncharacterized protein n=1 Tax=Gnathostoma spinigerum TaxID=75299 RepID=A0ABD6F240_9BILA